MAFLVSRKGSPYWQLRFIDAVSGQWTQKSTKMRTANRDETNKAKDLRDRYSIRQRACQSEPAAAAWSAWLPEYIDVRWGGSESTETKNRYHSVWRNWRVFLEQNGCLFPRQFTRSAVFDFLKWRQRETGPFVRRCGRNTAIFEIKVFGMWFDEAVRRGFCETNPCRQLGLSKDQPREKPEIPVNDIALIEQELTNEPEWMLISFKIAILHGVRLRATQVDLVKDVDWESLTVTFHEKGHNVYTVPMHPELTRLFSTLKEAGHGKACVLPINASRIWMRFFRRIKRPNYCFHCCRVTVITRLARNRVPENLAMKFVGHRSTEVHRAYQKIQPGDLTLCHLPVS